MAGPGGGEGVFVIHVDSKASAKASNQNFQVRCQGICMFNMHLRWLLGSDHFRGISAVYCVALTSGMRLKGKGKVEKD